MFHQVIADQAQALNALAQLSFPVPEFLNLVEQSSGTIVVTGMGKSGHIARKIASTFTSVGQPAHFLHPGDASHGDLGLLRPSDILFVLSKSGETQELRALLDYAVENDNPIVAITMGGESLLESVADLTFLLPYFPESGQNGLAPTISTIMMLALGDALALALEEENCCTRDDFLDRHPGGELGKLR